MKKILSVLVTSIAFIACNDECDHTSSIMPPSVEETTTVVGSWYNEEKNEEDRYSASGTFYIKWASLQNVGEKDGRYEFDGEKNRLTWNYNSDIGTNMFDDWKVTKLSDYELTIKSSILGTLEYGKILETIEFKEYGEVDTVAYLNIESDYPKLSIRSYSSSNERIATVSDVGKVVAKGEKGTAYIKVQTTIGNVWAKVIVGDDCPDLWFDYVSVIDADFYGVRNILGVADVQEEDYYGYTVGVTHDLLDVVDIFTDETTGLVDQIQLWLKSSVPTYKVDAYLKSHYYPYPAMGADYYITGPNPATCKALVRYAKEYNAVVFYSVQDLLGGNHGGDNKEEVEHLWTDYTLDFDKTPNQLKAAYGTPFYEDEESMYFYQYDEWMNMVAFSLDASTKEVYSISAFLNATCDWNKALEFLKQKYYYYEKGSSEKDQWYAFTNKSTLDSSDIGITFDGENGCITYVDLTYNYTPSYTRSFSAKKALCFNEESLGIRTRE